MKEKKQNKLLIKNMVCQRCILSVETILNNNKVIFSKVSLGEEELNATLSEIKLRE